MQMQLYRGPGGIGIKIRVEDQFFHLKKAREGRRWALVDGQDQVLYDSWPGIWEEHVALGMALHHLVAKRWEMLGVGLDGEGHTGSGEGREAA